MPPALCIFFSARQAVAFCLHALGYDGLRELRAKSRRVQEMIDGGGAGRGQLQGNRGSWVAEGVPGEVTWQLPWLPDVTFTLDSFQAFITSVERCAVAG